VDSNATRQAFRDRLQEAVRARLDRFAENDDRTAVLEGEAVRQAGQLAELLDNDGASMYSRYLLGWFYWYRYGCQHPDPPGMRAAPDLQAAIEMFMPCYLAGWELEELPKPLLPLLAEEISSAVSRLFEQAFLSTDLRLISVTIDVMRRFLLGAAAENPNRPAVLCNLGSLLHQRSDLTGEMADLDDAAAAGREAVARVAEGTLDRARYASNLGGILSARSRRTGALADADEAVALLELAVTAFPADLPDRVQALASLADARLARFERTGALADLDEAIAKGSEALNAAAGEQPLLRASMLGILGYALLDRFDRTGTLADLDQAVQVAREAVGLAPADGADGLGVRMSLGIALRKRAEHTGSLADLDEAVRISREALATIPANHGSRGAVLTLLSNALNSRFDQTGSQSDLDQAVQASREALAAVSPDGPAWAMYASNLGQKLRSLFERTGAPADLDEAVQVGREAVEAAPDQAMYASNLGAALYSRFKLAGAQEDLDEALQMARQAEATAPAGHADRPMFGANLAGILEARFHLLGAQADLDAAVRSGREAVSAAPADDPSRAGYASNLGNILRLRYERTGDPADLDQAVAAYTDASEVQAGPPSVRAWAARGAGTLAASSRPALAAKLLGRAVRMLPEVAPRQMARGDQQYALGGLSGVAADAAALALSDPSTPPEGRAAVALRLLEMGRAVLLSQALEVRSDLADLTHRHPDLAARFIRLRDQLDNDLPHGSDDSDPDRLGHERRRLASQLRALQEQIRTQDGFASFGLPPSEDELLRQARQGPVVVFNVSSYRSDALLVTAGKITSLALPDLREDAVYDQVRTFHRALAIATFGITLAERTSAQQQLNQTLRWLWDTSAGPVLDALGLSTQHSPESPWPRVWWAPGGLMGLLPIHAAGYHADRADAPGRRTVMDRVISSYTPTITALRYARRSAPTASSPVLIVAMPTTPGLRDQGRLPFVRREAELLARQLPDSVTIIEPDPLAAIRADAVPTLANILAQLTACPVAHFACHGLNDAADPSRSRLLLHDHDSAPFTVAALAPVRLDHAQLAYLSACQTAISADTRLIDESIHLASAFQLAGYRHVIGTLWPIGDSDITVRIAEAFYAGLTPSLDVSRAARSLHHAVRDVRDDYPQTPALWAAHIHTGA
jgi:tetratricopeptide (TPR) repeat protein